LTFNMTDSKTLLSYDILNTIQTFDKFALSSTNRITSFAPLYEVFVSELKISCSNIFQFGCDTDKALYLIDAVFPKSTDYPLSTEVKAKILVNVTKFDNISSTALMERLKGLSRVMYLLNTNGKNYIGSCDTYMSLIVLVWVCIGIFDNDTNNTYTKLVDSFNMLMKPLLKLFPQNNGAIYTKSNLYPNQQSLVLVFAKSLYNESALNLTPITYGLIELTSQLYSTPQFLPNPQPFFVSTNTAKQESDINMSNLLGSLPLTEFKEEKKKKTKKTTDGKKKTKKVVDLTKPKTACKKCGKEVVNMDGHMERMHGKK